MSSPNTTSSTNRLHFPAKIYLILENESPDIIRWHPNNKAFRITDHTRFEREIIPKYFRHNQMASVQRQLNLYGFKCVSRGEDKGSFYHPKFVRGDWEGAKSIRRCIANNQFGLQNWKLPEDFKQPSRPVESSYEIESICDTESLNVPSNKVQEIKKETITNQITQPVATSTPRKVEWHWPPASVVAQQRQVQSIISAFSSTDLTLNLEEPCRYNTNISRVRIPTATVSKPSFKWHGQFHLDFNAPPEKEIVSSIYVNNNNNNNNNVNNNVNNNAVKNNVNIISNEDYQFNDEKPFNDLCGLTGFDTFDDLMFICSDLDGFLNDSIDQSSSENFF